MGEGVGTKATTRATCVSPETTTEQNQTEPSFLMVFNFLLIFDNKTLELSFVEFYMVTASPGIDSILRQ